MTHVHLVGSSFDHRPVHRHLQIDSDVSERDALDT
jgi:hypothetical protein